MRALLLRAVMFCVLSTSIAAQVTWTGVNGTSWNDPMNWSSLAVPGATDDVVIAPVVNQPDTFTMDATCRSLDVTLAATLTLNGAFRLTVTDDVVISGTLAGSANFVGLDVGGHWTNDGTFTNNDLAVTFTGAGDIGGSQTTTFADLVIGGGPRIVVTAFSAASLDVQSTLDIGGTTVTIAGDLTATATVAGTGTVALMSNGVLATGLNAVPNVLVTSGTRTVASSTVTGNFSVTAGVIIIDDNATVSVGGSLGISSGVFSMPGGTPGADVLDVAGNVTIFAIAGTVDAEARICCGGQWTSAFAFVPSDGTVVLDGIGSTTFNAPSLHHLEITGDVRTTTSPFALSGNLVVAGGGILDTDAAATIAGNVQLAAISDTWDTGGFTHSVVGDWSGAGMTIGGGIVDFTGDGDTSGATLPTMRVSSGLRRLGSVAITGDLEVLGGTITIANDALVTVQGDMTLTAGTFGFEALDPINEIVDVEGDVVAMCNVGSFTINSVIRCAGSWTSSAPFLPNDGIVCLDGVGPVTLDAPELSIVKVFAPMVTSNTPLLVTAGLVIADGSQFSTTAPVNLDGDLFLQGNGSSWDLGNVGHSFSGDVVGGGGTFINGVVELDGDGALTDGIYPALRILSGVRRIGSCLILGNLEMTDGELVVDDNAHVQVQGDLNLTGGMLTFLSLSLGDEILDVAGNANVDAVAGASFLPSIIRCAGDWTSTATYQPEASTLEMTGPGTNAIVAPHLASLYVGAGTKTVTMPLELDDDLSVADGAVFDTDAALDIGGSVILEDANPTWDLGGFTHRVARDWSGSGTTGGGLIELDGIFGTIAAGTIDDLRIVSGLRFVNSFAVNNDLDITGGDLRVLDDTTITVGGNLTVSGGTTRFMSGSPLPEVLDVEGDVSWDAPVALASLDTVIRCGGDWTATAQFALLDGVVELDGLAPTTITIVPADEPTFADLVIRGGVRTPTDDLPLHATQITVEADGRLATGPHRLVTDAPIVVVDGELFVEPGGEWALAAGSTATVGATGTLSCVGTTTDVATVSGDGGEYDLVVDGTIAARGFLFRDMGPNGVVVDVAATIAPAPDDLRGGTFDFGSPTVGSALLTIERTAPTDLRYIEFLDTPGTGTFNVRSPGGAVVRMVNFLGAFSGDGFEDDPTGVLDWVAPEVTTLQSLTLTPFVNGVVIDFTTSLEIDLAMLRLERRDPMAVDFVHVASFFPLGGGASYGTTDSPLAGGQVHEFRVVAELTHGERIVLVTDMVVPSIPPAANTYEVGPNAPFADIQSAINAATQAFSVIRVSPGMYTSFLIDASTPNHLYIAAAEPGTVTIDTTAAPVRIENKTFNQRVQLKNLTIGDVTSPHPAIEIDNVDAVCLIDDVEAFGGNGLPAVTIQSSGFTAFQFCTLTGTPGLTADDSNLITNVTIMTDTGLTNASTIRGAEIQPGVVAADVSSSLTVSPGLLPQVTVPDFGWDEVVMANVVAEPNVNFVLAVGVDLDWFDSPQAIIELVGIVRIDPLLFFEGAQTDMAGEATRVFVIPPIPALQGVLLDFICLRNSGMGTFRWSNASTLVIDAP